AHLPALLEFFACRFNSGISARNVKAAAGLAVIGCRIRAPQDSFAVRLDGCNVEGDLHFWSNVVEGHILARRMHVIGVALFTGVKAGTRESRLPEAARFYRPPSETITGGRYSWLDELGGHGTSILNL